jgi:hypothetical protein
MIESVRRRGRIRLLRSVLLTVSAASGTGACFEDADPPKLDNARLSLDPMEVELLARGGD